MRISNRMQTLKNKEDMRILNNLLEGLLSLGRLGGDNSLFNDYLKGDNASDLRKDWETIGNDMRKVMNLKRKSAYVR